MEMNVCGRVFVNSALWRFLNRKYVLPTVLEHRFSKNVKRVLDLGCGSGDTTLELARRFPSAQIVGVDPDPYQIQKARWHDTDSRLRFLVGDGQRLPFKNGSFDAVFAFDVMHHIEQYKRAVLEVNRVLCKGGYFCCVDVDKKFIRGIVKWLDNTQSFFSEEEFSATLQSSGFTIKEGGRKSFFFFVIARKR